MPDCCSGVCVDLQTDTNNCGACGKGCGKGTCTVGHCDNVVASAPNQPGGIVVQGTNLYFTDPVAGTVRQVPVDGSTGPSSLVSGQVNPTAIAADAMNVYWLNAPPSGMSSVMMAPVSGGATTTLDSETGSLAAIAVDSTNVYWTNTNVGKVMTVPKGGGSPPTTLASTNQTPNDIAIDSTNVYWTNVMGSNVMMVPKAGAMAPTMLAPMQPGNLSSIVTDGTSVYWAISAGSFGGIEKVPVSGGNPKMLVMSGGMVVVAIDSMGIYWTQSPDGGAVMKANLDGSGATTLASGAQSGAPIAVDVANVYYWSGGNASLMSVTK
jgi:hypothetical protein